MKKSLFLLSILMVSLFSITLTSCEEDDDNGKAFVLSEYLIGTWKVYKSTSYYDGKVVNFDITKDGDLYTAYMELTLQEEEQAVVGKWIETDGGEFQWYELPATYTLTGNIITMHEEEGDEQYVYDEATKNIYLRVDIPEEEMVIYLYFKKSNAVSKV